MDFDLSADQSALAEAAATLLDRPRWWERLRARVGTGTVVGTLPGAGDSDGPDDGGGAPEGAPGGAATAVAGAPGHPHGDVPTGFDTELWAAMVEQGWPGVAVDEDAGGLGLGMVEVCVLCEQLGRRLASVPFLSSVLVLGSLAEATEGAAEDPRVAEWRQGLATGALTGCVAWAHRPGAVTVGGGADAVTLSGHPDPALWAPSADVALVVGEDSLFALALDAGARPEAQPAMDRTRELGWLDLDATPVVRLGGADAVTSLVNRAATGISAEMLGAAGRVLELSVDYARDRVQFGKPIGSFQAIKHRLADALVDVEGMRSTAYYAAWCVSAGDPEVSLAASMAKAWCSDAARRVMAAGLQVHGGIGFTWEHDMHLYLKRSQLDQVSAGDAPWHRDRIAGILRARLASGSGIL